MAGATKQRTLKAPLIRAQVALDVLPHGSVVLDSYGAAWQVSREYWYRAYGDDSMVDSFVLAQRAPFKTIYVAPKHVGLPVISDGFPPVESAGRVLAGKEKSDAVSEHVPTTEEVRRQYRAPAVSVDLTDPQRKGENFADYLSRVAGVDAFRHQQASYLAFDRWLAEYTREKQAEAWHEGVMVALNSEKQAAGDRARALLDNPYWKEKSNE